MFCCFAAIWKSRYTFVFSGHKIFAPTGIGVVYGKKDLLEAARPYQGGGNMIADVTFERTIYNPALPNKFEAGTSLKSIRNYQNIVMIFIAVKITVFCSNYAAVRITKHEIMIFRAGGIKFICVNIGNFSFSAVY